MLSCFHQTKGAASGGFFQSAPAFLVRPLRELLVRILCTFQKGAGDVAAALLLTV